MDNFESNWEAQQEELEQKKAPVSPFADSPYVTAVPQQEPVIVKKPKKSGKKVLSFILALAVLVGACGVTAACVSGYWTQKMSAFNQTMSNKLQVMQQKVDALQSGVNGSAGILPNQEGAMTPGQVYAQNVQAVVAISNQGISTNIYGQVSQTASSGSGFIISQDGYVVSNYHVVKGASKLSVITSDGTEYDATLVGYDSTNDLSVLKIEGENFPYVQLGSSDALTVGDQVMAIGNPLGELTSTLTVGYISAKDRAVNTVGTSMNMLQTDAAINSGNSGGPLFNVKGEVVGITTAKYSGTSSSGATIEGIGFAIPIDDVAGMIKDLVEKGYVSGAYLGVMVRDMDATVAQTYGLPVGIYVEEVTKGTCAETAGVQAKDIIINLAGHDISTLAELSRVLRELEPGQTTTITVYRGGQEVSMEITLDEKPQATEQEQQQQQQQQNQQQSTTIPGFGSIEDWFGSLLP